MAILVVFTGGRGAVQCVITGTMWEAFISQSAAVQSLQLSLKPLHTVTCGELCGGNKTNHPVHSLSNMWGRCIDLRALLLHGTKKRGTHYTIPLGAIFDPTLSLSLSKKIKKNRTACLKGSVSTTVTTGIIHAENKSTWFPPCVHVPRLRCGNMTAFQNQSQGLRLAS